MLNAGVSSATSMARPSTRAAFYDKYTEFALDNLGKHQQQLSCEGFKKYLGEVTAIDGKTVIKSYACESKTMRMFRAAVIDGAEMQVLNMSIFPRPEYDLPLFCADFFSTPARNIFVLDLNPLCDVQCQKAYFEKYFEQLLPLVPKYAKALPWGEKLTGESLKFFSPIVIWSRPESTEEVYEALYSAFQDYLLAWIRLSNDAMSSRDPTAIAGNREAQHRYLTWRATKDPGRPVLRRLLGAQRCEEYIHEFLFNGLRYLGTKSFTDYFPEYKCPDGSISSARSIMGRSYSKRPWDERGAFLHDYE